jgi:histidine ammonia-lyase
MTHRFGLRLAAFMAAAFFSGAAAAAPEYFPITPAREAATVTVTGRDLTIEDVVAVARHGARVQLSAEAKQRQAETYDLVNRGAAQGVTIYLFNRSPGFLRDVVRFEGDPLSPENRAALEARALAGYRSGVNYGDFPEMAQEDVVRAIMLVHLSQLTFRPASAGLTEQLVAMLNNRVTPVMRSRGGTGLAQGPASSAISAAIVGAGEAYHHGVRMPAEDALRAAGMAPYQPHPSDDALGASNQDVAGMSALLVHDARQLLEWTDLTYAIDLNGMNSSLTPLFTPVQQNRPFPWINWVQARVLDMVRGSYLFELDPTRSVQDPTSLRASYVRGGSAWQKWAELKSDVELQMNGSDGNPASRAGVAPGDAWELSTPWALQYYVQPEGDRKGGFIFSNGNWDPYPLGDSIEGFTISLSNLLVAVMLRQERFENTFFTKVKAHEVLGWADDGGGIPPLWNANHEVWQRIQGLINPLPPEGYSSDPEWVQDLAPQTLFKVERAVRAVEEGWKLIGADLVSGARWMDVRKAQDPGRTFGAAPTAAVAAFRQVLPLQPRQRSYDGPPPRAVATEFIRTTPAATFYPAGPPMPE